MCEEKDVLPGLMQNASLNIADILRFASVAHGGREIVSKNIDEPIWRYDYARAWTRAAQAAQALSRLDVAPGDRVSSLAWNTHRHFELFFAVPGMGAVLHTANPRLPDEHLVFTINHAGSKVLLLLDLHSLQVKRLATCLAALVNTLVVLHLALCQIRSVADHL